MKQQQQLTESAAIELATVLNQNGITCRFDPSATRDWLAKVTVPGHGRVCIFANGHGKVTIKTHELIDRSLESRIFEAWDNMIGVVTEMTLADAPQLALAF